MDRPTYSAVHCCIKDIFSQHFNNVQDRFMTTLHVQQTPCTVHGLWPQLRGKEPARHQQDSGSNLRALILRTPSGPYRVAEGTESRQYPRSSRREDLTVLIHLDSKVLLFLLLHLFGPAIGKCVSVDIPADVINLTNTIYSSQFANTGQCSQ